MPATKTAKKFSLIFATIIFFGASTCFAATDNTPPVTIQPIDFSFTSDSSDVTNCVTNDPTFDTFYIVGLESDFITNDVLASSTLLAGQTLTYSLPLGLNPYTEVLFTCGKTGDEQGLQFFTYGLFSQNNITDVAGLYTVIDAASSTTTVSSSTVQIVDNPTSDVFDGVVVFFMSMFGVLWLFRKKR